MYYQNLDIIEIEGYEIYYTRFSDSILKDHFQDALNDLIEILDNYTIEEYSLLDPGGGLSPITQRLAKLINDKGWIKKNIESFFQVEGRILSSESHEVDHYKVFDKGNIGLEIEWNNKDPFFDRDLENFRKLHQIGELSLGIIITRATSLQSIIPAIYKRFLTEIEPFETGQIISILTPISDKTKDFIRSLEGKSKEIIVNKIATYLSSSKYGTSTTHMTQLLRRIDRGVGNPCPFVLIGIGKERLR